MIAQCDHVALLVVKTDASAARGVVERSGAGRVKHLSAKQLWAQCKVARGEMSVPNIPSAENFSDLPTHHWSAAEGAAFYPGLGVVRREAAGSSSARRHVGSTGSESDGISGRG